MKQIPITPSLPVTKMWWTCEQMWVTSIFYHSHMHSPSRTQFSNVSFERLLCWIVAWVYYLGNPGVWGYPLLINHHDVTIISPLFPLSGILTPEKLAKPVHERMSPMRQLDQESRWFDGFVQHCDTARDQQDATPPQTPRKKGSGPVRDWSRNWVYGGLRMFICVVGWGCVMLHRRVDPFTCQNVPTCFILFLCYYGIILINFVYYMVVWCFLMFFVLYSQWDWIVQRILIRSNVQDQR